MKNKKNNKKVLLLTSVALIGVVAASIGGTYAWLVANRTASGTVTNIGATAPNNLDIALNGGMIEDDHQFELDANTKITDISGNGLAFYKPLIGAGSTNASPIFTDVSPVTLPSATTSNSYMISFTVTFSSTAALDVYVSSATFASTVSNVNSESGEMHKATRVAIVDSTSNVKAIIVDDNHTSTQYIKSDTFDGTLDLATITTVKSGTIEAPSKTTDNASPDKNIVHLGKLTGAGSTYAMTMTFRVWHEGTDAACISDNVTNIVNLAFGFSALNSAEEDIA